MGVNKVEYGSSTLVDLTGDTVTPETLLQGETAHNAAGNRITGTAKPGVQTFNGRSGSVLPIAGDYSADQVNYDSNKTVKQVIDALATKETSDITGQQSLLKDTVGWTGKNLLKNTATTQTKNGVTLTVNDNKSITVNGTATADVYFNLDYINNSDITSKDITNLVGETLIASISKTDVGIRLNVGYFKSDGYVDIISGLGSIYTSKAFVYPEDALRTKNFLHIPSGLTLNNVTVYPMLRKADITDPTYEPYHESVEVMYEEEIHGVNLYNNSETIGMGNSVVSLNNNGGFTLSGNVRYLATANYLSGLEVGENYIATIKVVSSNNSDARLTLRNSTKEIQRTTIFGTRAGIYSLPFTYQEGWFLSVICNFDTIIESTIVVEEVMVRKATIEDSTYRPYNHQAIQNQLNAQGVLGAKNLLRLTSNTGMGEGTFVGITASYSYNTDGSIKSVTLNGECTQTSDGYFYQFSQRLNSNSIKLLPNKEYIFSIGNANSNIALQVGYTKNNAYQMVKEGSYNEGVIKFITPSDCEGAGWTIQLIKKSGSLVLNNWIIYPMLRLASDPDDTYQPYAMTNRELTEYNKGFNFLKFLFNADGSDIYSGNLNDLHAGYAYYSNAAVNIPSNYYGYCITLERPSLYNYAVQIAINATGDSVNMYVRKKASNTWGAWKTVTMS